MAALPHIATLWVGDSLGWLGHLSLTSFAVRGHAVTLYHTHDLPDPGITGVSLRPARDVFAYDDALLDRARADVFADIFRLNMIRATGAIWVDLDVLCMQPLQLFDGYLVGMEFPGRDINNGVLCLPKDSPALAGLVERFADPTYVPEWLAPRIKAKVVKAAPEDRLLEATRLNTPALGPRALTWMLRRTGEDGHALPYPALNPVPWALNDLYFSPLGDARNWMTDDTMTAHIYSSMLRRPHRVRRPMSGSVVADIAEEVGFDLDAFGLKPNGLDGAEDGITFDTALN